MYNAQCTYIVGSSRNKLLHSINQLHRVQTLLSSKGIYNDVSKSGQTHCN
jgi:hypothetical protein